MRGKTEKEQTMINEQSGSGNINTTLFMGWHPTTGLELFRETI
jgi:hypothetical protein